MKIDNDTILNNEMYSLYCRLENEKLRHEINADEEYIKEEQVEKELANKWLKGESVIDAKKMYQCSGIKYAYDEKQLKEYYTEKSDSELLKQIVWIEREVSGYCMFPSRIYYIVNNILEAKDYKKLCQLIYELEYVPMQYGIILELKSHEDFKQVLKILDKSRLSHPITFTSMMRDRWFDRIVQATYNLSTYKEDDRIYNHDRYRDLIEKGQYVKKSWDAELDDLLKEGYEIFKNNISEKEMLDWVFKIRKKTPFNNNEYSRLHDEIVDKIRDIAMDAVSKDDAPIETSNLQLQMAIIENKLQKDLINRKSAADYWKQISIILESCNFIKNGEIHGDDERWMRIIGRLWIFMFDNIEEGVIGVLRASRTHFEGWNIDYSTMYDKVKFESFLLSVAVKVTFMTDMDEQEKLQYWKTICDYIVARMHCCDNEYISNEYLFIPLVFAEFHARKLSFSGLSYLRDIILTRVQSIDTVLKVFFMASSEPMEDFCNLLKDRIETEWPSCRVLMQLRKQTNQIAQYEEVIKNMTYPK